MTHEIYLTLDDDLLKALFTTGGDREPVKELLEKIIDAVLNGQAEDQIGAKLYERSDERKTYRNGYRVRYLNTRVGTLTLHIPKLRNGNFSTDLFRRYQRSEQALLLSLMEMVIQGVSTRKVSQITEELCGTKFSAETVSNLCQELDPVVEAFRNRQLKGDYPFVIADAVYMKVHKGEDQSVVSVGLFIAIGINDEGQREIIGFDTYDTESAVAWKAFFNHLKERGLTGVQMITSDDHGGITKAVTECFPGCRWQRCQAHFSRNVRDACPKKYGAQVNREIQDMFSAPTKEQCRKRKEAIIDRYEKDCPKAMKILDEGFEEVTSIYAFPANIRKRLRTSNAIERLNEELRRRERVIRIFPNEDSLIRLMGAVLMETHEKWVSSSKRYLNLDTFHEMQAKKAENNEDSSNSHTEKQLKTA